MVLIPCVGSMNPRQLGPMTRIPYFCAAASTCSSSAFPAGPVLPEARRDDDNERDFLFSRFLHDGRDPCCWYRNHRRIHRPRDCGKRGICSLSEDRCVIGIDRVEGTGKAEHVPADRVPDLIGVLRCAHDSNRRS